MNRITQLLLRKVFASVILMLSFTLANATVVENTKDDIEISVASMVDDSGKTLIKCVLSNHSQHTIATTNIQTPSSVFYFKLLDQSGKEIEQDPNWAKTFAQKSSERYRRPRSFRMDEVNPGGLIDFKFYLEDAYGSKSSNGQDLIVSWESSFVDKVVNTNDYLTAEGKEVKGKEEKYMFPPRWTISVSLPLKKATEKISEKTGGFDSTSQSSDAEVAETIRSKGAIDSNEKVISESKNQLWWFLLIPLMLLVLYVARCKKVF
jgi:hypothetical protein